MRAGIRFVCLECLARPFRQRLVLIIVRAVGTHVEAELSPRDELVEERLRVGAHSPPALACAGSLGSRSVGCPTFVLGELVKDLVRRDVTEMKPRRKTTGCVRIGVVALFCVPIDTAAQELVHAAFPSLETAFEVHRWYGVIDRQRPKGASTKRLIGG